MSSWQGALSVVGQVVGAYWGPVGSAIGGAVGSEIGRTIDGPQQNFGPRQDIRTPRYTYGGTLPRVYGRQRIAGFPAWVSPLIEVAHEEEVGKGGPVAENTAYTYKVHLWLLLAENTDGPVGQINAITRVWLNGKLVYTALADSDDDSLTASAATDAWESMTLMRGGPTQLPPPEYEAIVGTENATALRGRASLFFKGLDTGASGQLPLVEVEVATAGAGRLPGRQLDLRFASDFSDSSPYGAEPVEHGDMLYVHDGVLQVPATTGDCYVEYSGPQFGLTAGQAWRVHCRVSWGDLPNISNNIVWRWLFPDNVNFYVLQFYGDTGLIRVDGLGTIVGPTLTPDHMHEVVVSHDGISTLTLTIDGSVIGTTTVSAATDRSGSGKFSVGGRATIFGATRGYQIDDVYLDLSGGITIGGVDLADVVREEWLRCRPLSDAVIDLSELEGVEVIGVEARGPASEVTARLGAAYYFDLLCNDKLRARRRGGASVVSIPFLDTGVAHGQAGEPFTGVVRENDIEQPAAVVVTYYNLLADYEPGSEQSDRVVTASAEVRQVGLGVVLEPPMAKGRAKTMALDARVAAHTGSLAVSDRYAAIDCADIITAADHEGSSYRLRVLRTNDADGVRTLEVCLDDVRALHESGVTSVDYTPSVVVAPPGESDLTLLDIPILRDADDEPGIYGAVKGTGRWRGAAIQRSVDDITYATVATVLQSAVVGQAQSVLGAGPGGYKFDEVSTLLVDVGAGVTLSSTTRATLLADKTVNVIAVGVHGRWEILRFRTATLIAPGIYRLSGLLRGLRGTEHNKGNHEVGDTVVLLRSAGLARIDELLSDIGSVRYYKAVTSGTAAALVGGESFTSAGQALKPFSPVHLRKTVDNGGAIEVGWTRRTRRATNFVGTSGISAPLGEETERYYVELRSPADALVSGEYVTEPAWSASTLGRTGGLQAPAWGLKSIGGEIVGIRDDVLGEYTSPQRVIRFDAATGAQIAQSDVLGYRINQWCNNGDALYLVTADFTVGTVPTFYANGKLQKLTRTTLGTVDAVYNATQPGDLAGVAFDGTHVWTAGYSTGYLRKHDAATLAVIDEYLLEEGITQLHYEGGALWVLSRWDAHQVVKWDIATTAEVDRFTVDAPYVYDMLFVGGLVFVRSNVGLHVHDKATGDELYVHDLGSGGAGLAQRQLCLFGDYVVALNGSGVKLFDATTGELARTVTPSFFFIPPPAFVWFASGSIGDALYLTGARSGYSAETSAFELLAASLAGYSLTVRQVSASVGNGYPASITL
jgi:hypothetical protein